MKYKIILFIVLAFTLSNCNQGHDHDHDQDQKHDHTVASVDEHNHSTYDLEKIQFTVYSNEYELFAEADPFIVGRESNILSHFSRLPNFTALEDGKMSIRLIVDGKESIQTLDKPSRKGIYSFQLKPETKGEGKIIFDISTEEGDFQLEIPHIIVHETEHHAYHDVGAVVSRTNTTVFTKEQSWKIDFSTAFPKREAFGQIIKTTAQINSLQTDEFIISAKMAGILNTIDHTILDGKIVSKDQVLFIISGSGLADNNMNLRLIEAENNYEKTKLEYERAQELAIDKIVSAKDLLNAKNEYQNAEAVYNNLNKNFTSNGQSISSPMDGFIKQIFVKNGTYVEAGQTIVSVSQDGKLLLSADVQPKYASLLGSIQTAHIRTLHNNRAYSLEELNGHVLSYGKAISSDNYLIPIHLQIDNKYGFIIGGYVELYLQTISNSFALTIPNTALLEDQGKFFVYVQLTPELFEKREVSVGVTNGMKSEILKGLSSEERIVSEGAVFIKLAQATGNLDAHSGHVH
ncbi:MAG: efflux RND transporter periplasmic adaptor subunit [Bacteroidales bacterium]|nr:efflux RND transporter periplasmic adaptor subunit [Bacteroidales bacterium]